MRELVLTGHKDLWPNKEEDSLFLGPHCFCHNHKYEFLEQDKFQIVPSPWGKAQDILDASLYIDKLYDRIIPKLSGIMNSLYGLSYSEKFWNAYMILWLQHWLGILYDRYRRLEHVGDSLKERLVVKVLAEFDPTVSDFWSFVSKTIKGHYHNLLLMSDIIKHAQFDFLDSQKVNIGTQETLGNNNLCLEGNHQSSLILSKEAFRERLNSFFSSSMFLGNIYGLSLADKIYLQFSRDPVFLFKKRMDGPVKEFNIPRSRLNNARLEFGAENRFEKVAEEMLLKHIPDSLLTVYKPGSKTRSSIKTWVGMDIYTSQKKCSDIALILENGGRWISAQHGGVYGQSMSFPPAKMEYQMAGEFITWGWRHKHIYNAHYRPLPSPMLSKLKKQKLKKQKDANDRIVFVGTALIPYLYRLYNYLAPEQIAGYIKNKMLFLKHLEAGLLQKIKYRSYPHFYGVKEEKLLGNMLSRDQLISAGKLSDLFLQARLAVIDHSSTSLLEAMAMNIPTILYWDPAHFACCEAAAPYFDRLRSVGILHDRPEAAAGKVNEIWGDVSGWWNNPDIQRVKNDFCFQFARSSVNWRNEWAQFVKSL